MQIQDLQRANKDAKAEAERNKLRVESLQQHIENYTKYGVTTRMEDSAESSAVGAGAGGALSQTEHEQMKQENEQLKEYLNQYEQQIKDMEAELKNLK